MAKGMMETVLYGGALFIWRVMVMKRAYLLELARMTVVLPLTMLLPAARRQQLMCRHSALRAAARRVRGAGGRGLLEWLAEADGLASEARVARLQAAVLTYPDKRDAAFADICDRLLSELDGQPPGRQVALRASVALYHRGRISDAAALLSPYARSYPVSHLHRVMEGYLRLASEGYRYGGTKAVRPYDAVPGRVAYVANYSLPAINNGYVTRTHSLVSALLAGGQDIKVFTRFGFPADNFRRWKRVPREHRVDQVVYRSGSSLLSGFNLIPVDRYLDRYVEYLCREFAQYRPQVVHAASNYINGLAAAEAARLSGVRCIYEQRGLWEVTRLSREPWKAGTDEIAYMIQGERCAALAADRAFAITRGVVDEMERRGVPGEKFALLSNGVDCDRFTPMAMDAGLAAELGLKGRLVFGFIGSMVDYEGLDDLLEAFAKVERAKPGQAAILMVGAGAEVESLKRQAAALGIEAAVRFVGRVPFEQVANYYSLVDVAVFPRKPLPVCEMVSPLKPFEAMAMAKTCVVSDVAALAEIQQQSGIGHVFRKGEVDDLSRCLMMLVEQGRDTLADEGMRARQWVCAHRSWPSLAQVAVSSYQSLAKKAGEAQ